MPYGSKILYGSFLMKQCKHPTCSDVCRRVKEKKKPQPIKRTSDKRAKIDKEYAREAKKFREENPYCVIRSPICTHLTQGVHHVKGKKSITLLMDKDNWLASCNACNGVFIEENSQWAVENGFKKPDYKINK